MACRCGHTKVVSFLLADPRIDPDPDLLQLTITNNHSDVVEILLQDPRIDPSANKNEGIKTASSKGYTKIVYLAQAEDAELQAKAKWAADYLKLDYEYRFTGYGDLAVEMARVATRSPAA